VPELFPPRPEGRVKPVRSVARPERHCVDSLATVRLTIARVLLKWLPRCPLCHRCQQPARPTPHSRRCLRPRPLEARVHDTVVLTN
jgi:hypothetical protein